MRQMKLTEEQMNEAIQNFAKALRAAKEKFEIKIEGLKVKGDKAKIIFDPDAYKKMVALVDECQKEVAWHAVTQKQGNTYYINDIILFPQVVTSATVDSDDTEYALWVNSLDDFTFNNMRCHMHSHVNMGVSPSGVDSRYQQQMIENLEDYFIFMIWNKRGDCWTKIYDVVDNLIYENADIDIVVPENNNYKQWAKDQICNFVKESKMITAINKPRTSSYTEYQQMKLAEIDRKKQEEELEDMADELYYYQTRMMDTYGDDEI